MFHLLLFGKKDFGDEAKPESANIQELFFCSTEMRISLEIHKNS